MQYFFLAKHLTHHLSYEWNALTLKTNIYEEKKNAKRKKNVKSSDKQKKNRCK